jgi:hypothetical protein
LSEGEAALRAILETLHPNARDTLRRVLIHDQADRDAISSQLLRYRDGQGDDWADIIDMLTMYPDARGRWMLNGHRPSSERLSAGHVLTATR